MLLDENGLGQSAKAIKLAFTVKVVALGQSANIIKLALRSLGKWSGWKVMLRILQYGFHQKSSTDKFSLLKDDLALRIDLLSNSISLQGLYDGKITFWAYQSTHGSPKKKSSLKVLYV